MRCENGDWLKCKKWRYIIYAESKKRHEGTLQCDNGTIVARIADEKAWKEAQTIILDPTCLEEELEKRRTGDPVKEELESAGQDSS